MKRTRTYAALGALALTAAAALSACGGDSIDDTSSDAAGGEDCGSMNMAVNNWVGYEADAYVVGQVAAEQLGCDVEYKRLDEQVSWKGFGTGEVDVVIENWGHPELQSKYIKDKGGDGSATNAGLTGNDGIIGWYVPPWLAEEHPEVLDWENLNDFADEFATSESGGKGQLLDGDPSYVTNDEALVKNLKLNFKVVVGGSEAALLQSFKSAEKNKTPLIAYFYTPQWYADVQGQPTTPGVKDPIKLAHVSLPPYTEGCDADAAKVACDYPPYHLNKLIAKKFADSGSPAVDLIKNFQWTNADQNLVSSYIAQDGMSPDDAAKKWVEDNQDKVDAWLS